MRGCPCTFSQSMASEISSSSQKKLRLSLKNWVWSLWLLLLTFLSTNLSKVTEECTSPAHPGAGAGCHPSVEGRSSGCICPFLPERSSYRAENTTQTLALCCCCPWGLRSSWVHFCSPHFAEKGRKTIPCHRFEWCGDVTLAHLKVCLPLQSCAGMAHLLGADCRGHTRDSSGKCLHTPCSLSCEASPPCGTLHRKQSSQKGDHFCNTSAKSAGCLGN